MKKFAVITLTLLGLSSALFAAGEVVFMEYGVNYSSAVSPQEMENNTNGALDTVVFDAKIGGSYLRWADVYGGGSFMFFPNRADMQQHLTAFPVYIGFRANILPEYVVYPDLMVEFGTAFCNSHTVYFDPAAMSNKEKDDSWMGSYWNFGIGTNWNISSIAVLSLRVERPSIMNERTGSENHFFKSGLAWKIFY
jgi:hypothetical protein